MASSDSSWKTGVRIKLLALLENDPEALESILLFLYEEEDRLANCIDDESNGISPAWEILRYTIHSDKFEDHAKRLAEDIRRTKGDAVFRETMNLSFLQMLDALWKSDEMPPHDAWSWKDDVQEKLLNVFENCPETLGCILSYLVSSGVDAAAISHAWSTLYLYIDSEEMFKEYAETLVLHPSIAEEDNISETTDCQPPEVTVAKNSNDVESDFQWKDDIRGKLVDLLEDDPETLCDVFAYLEKDNDEQNSYVWRKLYSVIDLDETFKEYARSLLETTRSAEEFDDFSENLNFTSIETTDDFSWKDGIRNKLLELGEDDSEAVTSILQHLDDADEKNTENGTTGIPAVWEILRSSQYSDELFKECVMHVVEDMKAAENEKRLGDTISAAELESLYDLDDTVSFGQYDWKDNIRRKLNVAFGSDEESLERVFQYLDEEDQKSECGASATIAPAWNVLRSALYSDDVFREYANHLAEDTKKAETDKSFRESLDYLYLQMMDPLWIPEGLTSLNGQSWKDEIRNKLIGMFEGDTEILKTIFDQIEDEDHAWADNTTISPVWENLRAALDPDADDSKDDDDSWKNEIKNKLIEIFEDADSSVSVLFYLDEEDKAYDGSGIDPPVWKFLKSALYSDDVFREYAEQLVKDIEKAYVDTEYRDTMRIVYSQMLKPLAEPAPADHAQGFEVPSVSLTDLIPKPKTLKSCIKNPRVVATLNRVTRVVDKPIFLAGAAAVYLGIKAIFSVRRWRGGEITGKRCLKEVIDSTASLVGGAIGGLASGPAGFFTGILAKLTMKWLCSRFTQWLFNIPKDEALENAYNFLGVQMTASNNEINKAYHKLCLQHHPDKSGGNSDNFLLLQMHIEVIREARKGL